MSENRRKVTLDIRHEHFGTHLLEGFLKERWRKLSEQVRIGEKNETFVLSTLPGESHTLGLELVATVLAAAQRRPIYLGGPTPIDEIVKSAVETNAYAVAISICDRTHSMNIQELFEELRKKLPTDIAIIAGGCSAPPGLEYVKTFTNLRSFYDWLRIL